MYEKKKKKIAGKTKQTQTLLVHEKLIWKIEN